jgi:hypothetical protein
MASGTLERQTEVVAAKEVPTQEAVIKAAQDQRQEKVAGDAFSTASRAWNSLAQID